MSPEPPAPLKCLSIFSRIARKYTAPRRSADADLASLKEDPDADSADADLASLKEDPDADFC